MCKVRYQKFVLDILNVLGVQTDIFSKDKVWANIEIKFMGEKMRINGNWRLRIPPAHYFDYTYKSPDSISSYRIPEDGTFIYGDYHAICRNAVYLEINGEVLIDRR